jgi:hypothetical protein
MIADCLIGLAWIAIVLVPAIVAYRLPVVSHNGYLDNNMDPNIPDGAASVESESPTRV